MMRVLVCGGRNYSNYLSFAREMRYFDQQHGPFDTVIHGGAKGADWMAHLWANSPMGARKEVVFPADWDVHGRAAGPIRNRQMIEEGRPDLVIAFPGGRGTADMVRQAKAAGIPVVKAEQ
jgi:hypothetical protein